MKSFVKKNISRRSLLRGIAHAGSTAFFAPSLLNRTLASALGGGLATSSLHAQTAGITPSILLVYCSGGWDPTMVFDNKMGVPHIAQENGARAAVSVTAPTLSYVDHPDRPAVQSFFDRYGANAAIVNGISCGSMSSKQAAYHMLGTVPDKRARPVDWLTYYSYSLAPVMPLPHVVIDAPYMPGALSNVAVRLTSSMIEAYSDANFTGAHPAFDAAAEEALLAFRMNAFKPILEASNGSALDSEKLRALYYGQSRTQILGARLPELLRTIGQRQASDSSFFYNGKLAVELLAGGHSKCITLQAGANQAWDSSTNHYAHQSQLYQNLFQDLNALMDYAAEREVLSSTIIIVVSDTGRSPQLNAHHGKNPWPYTSALLWGPGIRGGTVTGLTDSALRGVPVDPIFGTTDSASSVTLEMGHVMGAIYLKTNVPVSLILPHHSPLSQILGGG